MAVFLHRATEAEVVEVVFKEVGEAVAAEVAVVVVVVVVAIIVVIVEMTRIAAMLRIAVE